MHQLTQVHIKLTSDCNMLSGTLTRYQCHFKYLYLVSCILRICILYTYMYMYTYMMYICTCMGSCSVTDILACAKPLASHEYLTVSVCPQLCIFGALLIAQTHILCCDGSAAIDVDL